MANPFPFSSGDILTAAELNGIGEWTAYTPTVYNMVVGNGTVDFKYAQINKVVHLRGVFTMGSTSTFGATGAPFFSLPIPSAYLQGVLGHADYIDATGADYVGYITFRNAGTTYFGISTVTGTYPTRGLLGTTVPFTWTTGDYLSISATYEVA